MRARSSFGWPFDARLFSLGWPFDARLFTLVKWLAMSEPCGSPAKRKVSRMVEAAGVETALLTRAAATTPLSASLLMRHPY